MSSDAAVDVVLGVDIGTSSSKAVIVTLDGEILATASRAHEVSRPVVGRVEMDAAEWWDEFSSLSLELRASGRNVVGVGVSGMGPCVAVADVEGASLRPAILYGVDTRAVPQIKRLTDALGADAIVERCGSALSTQAVGPKLAWIAENEPDIWARARKLLTPSSYLVHRLTGAYVLDHHSASQCTPLYDTAARTWYTPWADALRGNIELPELVWPGDIVGRVTTAAAAATGLPVGAQVIAGTIDAWAEALSVGAQNPGDLMLMYGTTMFLIATTDQRMTSSELWGTVGAIPGTYNLAAGMATSGAITEWLRYLFGGADFSDLLAEAEAAGQGARGLLMLPYFAGERTPIADPDARGAILGLTLSHTRGDLYRAALEATAMGVRHNIDAFSRAGARVSRVVAVGGGTQGALWTQIVSDVTGLEQVIPSITIGASFGGAFLAASAVVPAHRAPLSIEAWNPLASVVSPRSESAPFYATLFELYLELYSSTSVLTHRLGNLKS